MYWQKLTLTKQCQSGKKGPTHMYGQKLTLTKQCHSGKAVPTHTHVLTKTYSDKAVPLWQSCTYTHMHWKKTYSDKALHVVAFDQHQHIFAAACGLLPLDKMRQQSLFQCRQGLVGGLGQHISHGHLATWGGGGTCCCLFNNNERGQSTFHWATAYIALRTHWAIAYTICFTHTSSPAIMIDENQHYTVTAYMALHTHYHQQR
jgi:hypothetical protein